MSTIWKKAIELLQEGDRVMQFANRPNFNVYRGTVKSTVVVDAGVQINYTSGHIITHEGTMVEVKA